MNKNELKEALLHIQQDEIAVFVYFVMKTGVVEMANINEVAVEGIKTQLLQNVAGIIASLESEEFSLLQLSTADERSNAIFEYDLAEDNYPVSFRNMLLVKEHDEDIDYWRNGQLFDRNDSVKDIDAVIFSMGIGEYNMIGYRKYYPYESFEVNSGFFSFSHDNQIVLVDSPLIRLNGKFDFFLLEDHFVINNLTVLEKYSDIKVVIQNQAQLCVNKIEEVDIVSDLNGFKERIQSDISFARKVMKVANDSEVINQLKNHALSNEAIFAFINTRPKLAEALKVENEKIDLKTKKSQNAFLKLLDDSYLHSMLTNMNYTTNSKDLE